MISRPSRKCHGVPGSFSKPVPAAQEQQAQHKSKDSVARSRQKTDEPIDSQIHPGIAEVRLSVRSPCAKFSSRTADDGRFLPGRRFTLGLRSISHSPSVGDRGGFAVYSDRQPTLVGIEDYQAATDFGLGSFSSFSSAAWQRRAFL